MKLWHDDIRRPPDDTWTWCRTNAAAERFLLHNLNAVTEASLDHDLGFDTEDPDANGARLLRGDSELTGRDLARWMVENDLVPPKVTVHSWSPPGAAAIAAILREGDPEAEIIVRPASA